MFDNESSLMIKQKQFKAGNDLNSQNNRYDKSQNDIEIQSKYSQFKSKSVEKSKKELSNFISARIKIMKKMNDSKSIKEENPAFFNASEINSNKNRNMKSSSSSSKINIMPKPINRSCALHFSQTKEESKSTHMPQFSKFKCEYSVEKKRNRLTNSKQYLEGRNSTLNVFSNLMKINTIKKKKRRNIDRINGPNIRKISHTKSLKKSYTNYWDSKNKSNYSKFKIKNMINIKLDKNNSCGSLKAKKLQL